jgi:hypothetical protein
VEGHLRLRHLIDATDRIAEIYRFVGPDGGVVMKWNSSFWGNQSIGGYAEAADPEESVYIMQNDPLYLDRWPYDIRAAFGYGWDAIETKTEEFIDASLSLSGDDGRVIVSNEVDFFRTSRTSTATTSPSWATPTGTIGTC